MFRVKLLRNCLVSAKENHVIMHFLTSETNNWSGPVNIWSGPAASGSNRPDCLAAKKINVEPWNVLQFFLNLEIFESNTTSDWLNHYGLVNQRLYDCQNLKKSCRKRQRMFLRIVDDYRPWSTFQSAET